MLCTKTDQRLQVPLLLRAHLGCGFNSQVGRQPINVAFFLSLLSLLKSIEKIYKLWVRIKKKKDKELAWPIRVREFQAKRTGSCERTKFSYRVGLLMRNRKLIVGEWRISLSWWAETRAPRALPAFQKFVCHLGRKGPSEDFLSRRKTASDLVARWEAGLESQDPEQSFLPSPRTCKRFMVGRLGIQELG